MDKGLQDPSNQMTFGKFEKPVAESKYIVSVKSKVLNWRNFLYFSGMSIFPAHVLKTVDGAGYLKDYNFKLLPGSGAYKVEEADIQKGKSVSIRRRTDYWAEEAPPQRRREQLRRDPRGRGPRPEARLRDVQEGRHRRLLRERLA